jgi:hypothetical protein
VSLLTANYDSLGNQTIDQNEVSLGGSPVYRGTWINRPNVTGIPGKRVIITDVGVGGNSIWQSDGVTYRPANGRIVLYQKSSLPAAPIVSLSPAGGAIALFVLPETLLVPAGMLFAGCKLINTTMIRRSAAGAGAAAVSLNHYLGVNNSSADDIQTAPANSGAAFQDNYSSSMAIIGPTPSSGYMSTSTMQLNVTANGAVLTRTSNCSNNMYFNYGVGATCVAGDTYGLIHYQITLEG